MNLLSPEVIAMVYGSRHTEFVPATSYEVCDYFGYSYVYEAEHYREVSTAEEIVTCLMVAALTLGMVAICVAAFKR